MWNCDIFSLPAARKKKKKEISWSKSDVALLGLKMVTPWDSGKKLINKSDLYTGLWDLSHGSSAGKNRANQPTGVINKISNVKNDVWFTPKIVTQLI